MDRNFSETFGSIYLIGNPVKHSISPQIHNAAFQKANLPYIYELKQLFQKEIPQFIDNVKKKGIPGFNITLPYKSEILKYMDKIDPIAQKIGAINTVKNENGVLLGYNTDIDGIQSACLEAKFEVIPDQNIVIFGAGGAARSLAFYFSSIEYTKIFILNRTYHKAEEIRNDLTELNIKGSVQIADYPGSKAFRLLEIADLIINATSVGMWPKFQGDILRDYIPNKHQAVFDLVYNPIETPLVKKAKKQGCKIISGLDMLIYQAVKAFKFWTGVDPDIELMKKTADECLQLIFSE
jgi:shikimate dehydrogenase